MNMQINELMTSLCHNFPLILFIKMTKIPYFSYEKVKLATYPNRIEHNSENLK